MKERVRRGRRGGADADDTRQAIFLKGGKTLRGRAIILGNMDWCVYYKTNIHD